MKIAVLSRNPRLYSTRRLVEAGTERGHEMVVIDTLRAYMNIASHKPQIHYRGKPLEGFDAVIPRIGASVTFYGCAVLRQFEMMGCFRSTNRWPSPARGTSCARCNCCRAGASACR
jgi:ribosomal protein S6--L-glutamate ligase